MSTEFPRRLDVQTVDSRAAFENYCGVDFGSDARVLAVRGLLRLVWAKGSKTPYGMRGMGHIQRACSLQLRRFRLESGDEVEYGSVDDIFEGGRISRTRLLEHAGQIDSEFGDGATARLDPKVTVLFTDDAIAAFIARKQAEPRYVPPEVLALIEAARTATVTRDDFGCKL